MLEVAVAGNIDSGVCSEKVRLQVELAEVAEGLLVVEAVLEVDFAGTVLLVKDWDGTVGWLGSDVVEP